MELEILSVTPDPQKIIEQAGRTCYQSADKITGSSNEGFIRKLIKAGHLSVLEHAVVTFRMKDVSRALTHQLVRHRLCSFSQQSQRYVNEDDFSYVIPSEIEKSPEIKDIFVECMEYLNNIYRKLIDCGIRKEDARYVLPNSCNTEIVFSCNFRQLRHILLLRGSAKAQGEIREVFIEILEKMKDIAPDCFFDFSIDKERRVIQLDKTKEM
ncbi:FAD-dependent thymidylate synthase [Elusimicrobiota bacterium]